MCSLVPWRQRRLVAASRTKSHWALNSAGDGDGRRWAEPAQPAQTTTTAPEMGSQPPAADVKTNGLPGLWNRFRSWGREGDHLGLEVYISVVLSSVRFQAGRNNRRH